MNARLDFCTDPTTLGDPLKFYCKQQKQQKRDLNRFAGKFNNPSPSIQEEFEVYRRQWLYRHERSKSLILELTTVSSLAAQISSSSVYENAGLSLDFIRGYPVLDSRAIKGLAKTYAATVWFPEQFAGNTNRAEDKEQELQKAVDAWAKIERVFGYAPESYEEASSFLAPDLLARIMESRATQPSARGTIVFATAIPRQLTPADTDDGSPRLHVEIINNHHTEYYNESNKKSWPGEWETPSMSFFLAIRPGAVFQFPLLEHTADVDGNDLSLAREWLIGGLTELGFGAKTGVGYGRFATEVTEYRVKRPPEESQHVDDLSHAESTRASVAAASAERPVDLLTTKELISLRALLPGVTIRQRGHRLVLEAEMKLLTPAFLAGANQTAEQWQDYLNARDDDGVSQDNLDEQLHTLIRRDSHVLGKAFKAGLRTWFRTMHSGFLNKSELLKLESEIFGSTEIGQALIVEVTTRDQSPLPYRFDFKDHDKTEQDGTIQKRKLSRIVAENRLGIARIPEPENHLNQKEKERIKQTPQGLFYASYGMDQPIGKKRRDPYQFDNYKRFQRYLLFPPQTWNLKLSFHIRAILQRRKREDSTQSAFCIVSQLANALRLFSLFGGVGGRSRKGFGSFQVGDISAASSQELHDTIENAMSNASDFRQHRDFDHKLAGSFALQQLACDPTLIFFKLPADAKFQSIRGVDALGSAVHAFVGDKARQRKHYKAGLGLPRKTKNGRNEVGLESYYRLDSDGHPRHDSDPENLEDRRSDSIPRWASPILFRGFPREDGFAFCVLAFKSLTIPFDKSMSGEEMLTEFVNELKQKHPFPEPTVRGIAEVELERRARVVNEQRSYWAKLITDPRHVKKPGKQPTPRTYIETLDPVEGSEMGGPEIRKAVLRCHPEDEYLPDPKKDVGKVIQVQVTKINAKDVEFCVVKGARAQDPRVAK